MASFREDHRRHVWAFLGVCLLAPLPAHAERSSVLILPITAQGGASTGLASAVGAALLLEAARIPGIQVVSLQELETTLAHEQMKQLAACDTQGCAMQIAGALNADQIIMGTLTVVGEELVLSASRLDARSTEVVARIMERCPVGQPKVLLDRAPIIVGSLLGQGGMTHRAAAAPVAPHKEPSKVANDDDEDDVLESPPAPLSSRVLLGSGMATLMAVPVFFLAGLGASVALMFVTLGSNNVLPGMFLVFMLPTVATTFSMMLAAAAAVQLFAAVMFYFRR